MKIEIILADCAILPGTVGYTYLVAATQRAVDQNPPRSIFKDVAEELGVNPNTLRYAVNRTLEDAGEKWDYDKLPEMFKRAISARTGAFSSREFVCTVAHILRQDGQ